MGESTHFPIKTRVWAGTYGPSSAISTGGPCLVTHPTSSLRTSGHTQATCACYNWRTMREKAIYSVAGSLLLILQYREHAPGRPGQCYLPSVIQPGHRQRRCREGRSVCVHPPHPRASTSGPTYRVQVGALMLGTVT